MKNKKLLMGLAALMILVFHFYIPFGHSSFETFFSRSAYIGVDIFFFVSAYSLGTREDFKTLSFYRNRLLSTYLPFVIFACIMTFYKKWSLQKFLLTICGASFFQRGGGSFLWFIIGIMLLYIITPAIVYLKKRMGLPSLAVLLGAWLVLVIILQYGLHNTNTFILLNRIPIFLLGFYYDRWHCFDLKKFKLPASIVGIVVGALIVFYWGTTKRLSQPITDIYYIIAIPYVLSIVEFTDWLTKKLPFRIIPLEFIGGMTLELYGFQMIFGYDIERKLMKATGQNFLSFILAMLILIAIAFTFSSLRKAPRYFMKKIKENRQQ